MQRASKWKRVNEKSVAKLNKLSWEETSGGGGGGSRGVELVH